MQQHQRTYRTHETVTMTLKRGDFFIALATKLEEKYYHTYEE